jgi:hypothetical protein
MPVSLLTNSDGDVSYSGSPVPATGQDGTLQLIGPHGLGAVTRKREPL